ncbi:MAG: hypothetical protein DMF42_03525 [Verrucomicrobia bacterium]|nr:MAG: hypothetical protein DMF42_03525 [Verrucomicrobiota bacterium]
MQLISCRRETLRVQREHRTNQLLINQKLPSFGLEPLLAAFSDLAVGRWMFCQRRNLCIIVLISGEGTGRLTDHTA